MYLLWFETTSEPSAALLSGLAFFVYFWGFLPISLNKSPEPGTGRFWLFFGSRFGSGPNSVLGSGTVEPPTLSCWGSALQRRFRNLNTATLPFSGYSIDVS